MVSGRSESVFLRSFKNNPKEHNPSYKMDLDLWRCFKKGKIGIIAKFHRTNLVI